MSARAFSNFPRQFAKAARFQRAAMPQMKPNYWKQTEATYNFMKKMQKPVFPSSKSFSEMVTRFKTTEMQRVQIGALYMFSYVTQEILDMAERYNELLNDEEVVEDEDLSKVTTTGRTSQL